MSRGVRAALICLVVGTLLSAEAAATTCSDGPRESFPSERQPAPRNTKLWLSNAHVEYVLGKSRPTAKDVAHSFRLLAADGRELDYDVGELNRDGWGAWFFVVTPRSELEPGEYRFGMPRENLPPVFQRDSPFLALIPFQVIDERWLKAPTPPKLDSSTYRRDEEDVMCGVEYVALSVSSNQGSVLVMELGQPRAVADPSQTYAEVSVGAGLAVGSDCCLGNWDFDRGSVEARAGVFDLAGNFSGWSEPKLVGRPAPEPRPAPEARPTPPAPPPAKHGSCACRSVPVHSGARWLSGAWAFACCLALVARRSRV